MKYIGKKLSTTLITLLCISFLVYLAFDVIPGDAALAALGTDATPESLEALREQLGLNRPFLQRYVAWLFDFIRGDFGMSYKYQMPVAEMIGSKLPITIIMAVISFFIMIAISLPVGIYTAKHSGKLTDRLIMAVNQVMMSVPHFFMGIMITYLFGLILKLFTPGGFVSYETDFGGFLAYIIFPCIAIAIPKIAMGSIVIEQVFNIPGIGRILLTSISYRDYPVVETIIVLIAFVVIVTNFFVDLIYQLIDPRISV